MPPIPKRSDQRRRRNLASAVDTVTMSEPVVVPELALTDVHPLAADMYESLKSSGQSQYFEPSDWQRARLMCEMLSRLLYAGKLSSMLYTAIQQDMAALLMTEADRRKLRLEIDRGAADTSAEDAKVSQMAAYRRAASH